MTADQIHQLKRMGFTAVTYVHRDISVVVPGGVVGAFKHLNDAKRFATQLNKLYGCRDGYQGRSL